MRGAILGVGFVPAALAALLGAPATGYAEGCPVPSAGAVEQWQGESLWQALADGGYRIGRIHVTVADVFNLDDPEENTWYGRAADALHINTRPRVIHSELLFRPGEPVNPRLVYESERRLRSLSFLRDASIEPEACNFHTVDVAVHVKDAWTLKFDLNFAHVGGQNQVGAGFKDVDFLGTGKTLEVAHQSNSERSVNLISYQDPSLLGSHWQIDTTYAHQSDGYIRSFAIGQPFYENAAPWSFAAQYLDQKQDVNFYDAGTLAWRTSGVFERRRLDWGHLVDWQGDTGTRAGLAYVHEDETYGPLQSFPPLILPPPELTPRHFGGLAVTGEYYQDRYASFSNLALMSRTEDYNLGWVANGELGYFGKFLDSDVPALFYDGSATYGSRLRDDTLLFGAAYLRGRHQDGVNRNVISNLVFTLYDQHFDSQTLVAHVNVDYGLRPDPESLFYLGGLQGMPGYPNYFAIGDRRWQVRLADRVYTPVRIWNIFQLGFSAYTDIGQIRQPPPAGWSRTLADAGLALRFGDVRSAYGGVIYITVAWPLVKMPGAPGHQFVIGNIINF